MPASSNLTTPHRARRVPRAVSSGRQQAPRAPLYFPCSLSPVKHPSPLSLRSQLHPTATCPTRPFYPYVLKEKATGDSHNKATILGRKTNSRGFSSTTFTFWSVTRLCISPCCARVRRELLVKILIVISRAFSLVIMSRYAYANKQLEHGGAQSFRRPISVKR